MISLDAFSLFNSIYDDLDQEDHWLPFRATVDYFDKERGDFYMTLEQV